MKQWIFLLLLLSRAGEAVESWETKLALPESIKTALRQGEQQEFDYFVFDRTKLQRWAGACYDYLTDLEESDAAAQLMDMSSDGAINMYYSLANNQAVLSFSGASGFLEENWLSCRLSDEGLSAIHAEALETIKLRFHGKLREKEAAKAKALAELQPYIEASKQWALVENEGSLYAQVYTVTEGTVSLWLLFYENNQMQVAMWDAAGSMTAPINGAIHENIKKFCASDERKLTVSVNNTDLPFRVSCLYGESEEPEDLILMNTLLLADSESARDHVIQEFIAQKQVDIGNARVSAKGFTKVYKTLQAYYQ